MFYFTYTEKIKKYGVNLLTIILLLISFSIATKAEEKWAWVYYEDGGSIPQVIFFNPNATSLFDTVKIIKEADHNNHKFRILLKNSSVQAGEDATGMEKIGKEELITKSLEEWSGLTKDIKTFEEIIPKDKCNKFAIYGGFTYNDVHEIITDAFGKKNFLPESSYNNNQTQENAGDNYQDVIEEKAIQKDRASEQSLQNKDKKSKENNEKKSLYQQSWFWVLVIGGIVAIGGIIYYVVMQGSNKIKGKVNRSRLRF